MPEETESESSPRSRAEQPRRRPRSERNDGPSPQVSRLGFAEAWCLLERFEADERGLVIERGLQQVNLGLKQIALCLGHEKARRQADLVSPLLDVEPLARDGRALAGRFNTLAGTVHVPAGPA